VRPNARIELGFLLDAFASPPPTNRIAIFPIDSVQSLELARNFACFAVSNILLLPASENLFATLKEQGIRNVIPPRQSTPTSTSPSLLVTYEVVAQALLLGYNVYIGAPEFVFLREPFSAFNFTHLLLFREKCVLAFSLLCLRS
jgi:hypothetical protein